MTLFRAIPLSAHGAIEAAAAPALIVAPFLLGFEAAAGAISIAVGAALLGLALSVTAERQTLPLSAHAAFDYVVGIVMVVSGLHAGVATEDPVAAVFLAGFGAAHLALTASTRFSVRSA